MNEDYCIFIITVKGDKISRVETDSTKVSNSLSHNLKQQKGKTVKPVTAYSVPTAILNFRGRIPQNQRCC